jgi:lycopene beta-cyclase
MKETSFDFIICGGGASGLLLLDALRKDSFFDDYRILLLEKEIKNSNDRTWCFWETPQGPFDELLTKKWDHAQFKSSELQLDFQLAPLSYKMLRSSGVYKQLHTNLKHSKNTFFKQAEIKEVTSEGNQTRVFTSHESFIAKRVFNSLFDPKPLKKQKKYPVLQQHFVGWYIKTEDPVFDPEKLLFMDFDIPQKKETRFLYLLPLDTKTALVEYTLFSEHLLPLEEYEMGIQSYLKEKGITEYTLEEKEQGTIPMTCFPFEQFNTQSLLHIGTAGGWTKASTGFTFMNTRRNVARLCAFLKTDQDLNNFKIKNRFRFYDLLFLDVLTRYNSEGSSLFSRMFEKNPPVRIFHFLDEKTSFWEELSILASFSLKQKSWFIKALFQRIF